MGDTGGSFAPLPGAPMFFKAPEAEPPTRPMSTEYGFARRMEELFQPLGPKRAKHTFTTEELNEIDSRPPEAYLAKPPRVKVWNMKKARLLNIPNLKIELKQETQQQQQSDTQRWSQECVTVSFCVSADKKIEQTLSMELTSNQIKLSMFELAGIQAKVEDYDLRIPAINHVVSLDNLALQTFIQACLLSRISPLFEVVPKSSTNSSDDDNLKKHIQTELEIFELVGLPLARTLDLYKPEVIASRRALAALRLGVTRNHHTSSDAELQQFVYVESEPLPLTIPSNVSVVAQLPINAIRITVSVDPTQEVDEARNKIFRKFSIIDKANSQGKSANDYVLKATGFREYLVPSLNLANNNRHQISSSNKNERFKLIDYDFIRKRISKNQQIELTLVDVADLREQIAEAEGESIIDHLLCAEFESEQAQAQQVTNGKIETNFEDSYDPPFPSLLNTRPIPATKMHRSFRIKACCVRDTRTAREDVFTKFKEKEKGDPSIYVKMELFHGGQSLAPAILTPLAPAPVSEKDAPLVYPQWDEWREFPIKISDLPKATVVSFTIYAGDSDLGWTASSDIKGVPLGWGNIQLVDYDGCIRMGLFARKLWEDGVANPIGTCMDNVKKGAATLLVEFETFIRPLVYSDPLIPTPAASSAASSPPINININTNSPGSSPPTSPVQTHRNMYDLASIRKSSYNLSSSQLGLTPFRKIETAEARQLQTILQYDPLTPLTPSDKKMMWNFRNLTRPKYRALPKFLQSVAWNDSEQVAETHRLLEVWAVPPPVLALQLLDAKFPDETVRNYAVTILNSLTDAEVSDFLPQLVQVLKYELHHDSPLARLLIERALRNRSRIGHSFFWFLRAEMHVSEIEERYGILLEGYLRSCGRHRTELLKQHQVLKDLYSVAMAVKNAAPTDRKKALMDGLSQVKFPERFQLPLDPRWEVKGLIQDKCRFMDSKKLPLWLTFENVEPNAPPINVIFKVGDDIRQDILTLQMIRIMDKMWKNASMDLRLNPYGTVSMGDSIGMIEVVLNSKTIASINKDAGGTGAVLADKSLDNWLRKHNPSDALYSQAVKTFILSCAGYPVINIAFSVYVVATYVLGIGDRHADNIMMSRSGHLFHIDFGHFLGNFKSKFGFKRERAPFIFTAQYLAIVGGKDSENFKYFVDVCCKAYNIIRKQSDLFMNLFQLMVSTGIPELQSIDDINYLRKTLAPELSDDDAASEFSKNILVALNTKTVIINDIIHGWVH